MSDLTNGSAPEDDALTAAESPAAADGISADSISADSNITDGAAVSPAEPSVRKRLVCPAPLARLMKPFEGMRHIWLAFLFPVLIMALIYFAMEVWPFGKSSVLVLDLNGQYVYFFEAMRDILRGEQGILYSFERALGGEFLGIVAYYLASPFTFLVALFPEGCITESLFCILLLKCGLSGMNMCVYLHKSHPTKPINEIIFSCMYALTSYAVVMQHNTMWFDCVLFFPLILLGVEELIKRGRYKLYVITLTVACISNFYIGYMVCIGVAAYFFFYYCVCTKEERNPLGERAHFIKSLGRIALFSLLAVGMACIIIFPAYYALTFGKTTFSKPNFSFDQKFDFLDLLSKMFPASYDTVRPEGWPFVFSGLLTTILLPVFFMVKEIPPRKKIAYGALIGFFAFSFNGSTIDLVWHGFQRPNWLNYRYSFMFCFVMIVAAYLVFEHIEALDTKVWLGVGAVLGLLVCILQKLEYDNVQMLTVWVSLGFIAAYMILLSGCQKRWLDGSISRILCSVVLFELFLNGLAETIELDNDVHYSSRASYVNFQNVWKPAADWMNENDTSFYRAEKTEHRKTNDNFMLNLRGLSNSTSTLNAKQIEFLRRMGYSSKSHWSKYLGGTPVSDSLLGIKYLLTLDTVTLNDVWGEPIFADEEHMTRCYQNLYAQSLGYMTADLSEFDMEDYASPFDLMNALVTEMLGSDTKLEIFKPYKNIKPDTENLEISYVTGHKKYYKTNANRAGKLLFTFTPVNGEEIFAYFPSEYPRDAKLKVNGSDLSEYFTNETCRIVSLGKQPEGEELIVSLSVTNEEVYIANGVNYFWYLDEELFAETMKELQKGGYGIDRFTDSHFEGSIAVPEDRTNLLLTIPYDKGWRVFADGEECETFETLGALTAVTLTPGGHTLVLDYDPACVRYGIAIASASLGLFILIWSLDALMKQKRLKAPVPDASPASPDAPLTDPDETPSGESTTSETSTTGEKES